jgi:hypothetical protein
VDASTGTLDSSSDELQATVKSATTTTIAHDSNILLTRERKAYDRGISAARLARSSECEEPALAPVPATT